MSAPDGPDGFAQRVADGLGAGYRIEKELGGGGMSRVFLARDLSLDRLVVVKVQSVHGAINADRFRREIALAAQLQHPHVVPLLTAGSADGLLFFTMPFVAGESLRTLIDRDGALPVPRARILLRDIARALSYAHGQGIVHRDIKPDNVLLSSDLAMVTDFGVAKALSSARETEGSGLTEVGTSLGTPTYIAPEQAAGDPAADHRADLYSFGALGYEVLTGKPPFAGRSPRATIAAHIAEAPPPIREALPDLPDDLAALVMGCLEKEPERRPQTAAEIVTALESPEVAPAAGARRRSLLVGAAFVVLAAGGAWLWSARGGPATGPDPRSIGVVPFQELGDQKDYFADGMTEELVVALSRIKELKVASRSSAFALKNQSGLDAKTIGRRLGVASVLEGSVRRAGDRLRLTAQLSSTQTGLVVWSQSFERGTADLFSVQDDLTAAIVRALKLELAPAGTATRGTNDLEAYDAYLRGRHLWRQRTRESLAGAIELFLQAIARDSSFGRAWAGLADARVLLTLYNTTTLASAADSIRGAANRAIALDSGLAEAHATLGNLEKSLGNWAEGERELRQAVSLDSTDTSAWQWLGEVLAFTGQPESALVALRRATALDSTAPMAAAMLGYAAALAGHDSLARASIAEARRLAPGIWAVHVFEAAVGWQAGRPAEAVEAFRRALPLTEGPTAALVRGLEMVALADAGDQAAVAALATSAATLGAPSDLSRALVALAVGDRAQSLRHLTQAVAARDAFLYASSLNAPWWKALRGDPEFVTIARSMGLDPARLAR